MNELTFKYPRFISPAIHDKKKFVVVSAGRRVGKTYNFVQWLVEELVSSPGKKAIHVDTTQTNIGKYVDRYYRPILGDLWRHCKHDKVKHILSLPNRSYIDFGSAERPESLEGFEYDYALLNEAGIILKRPQLWDNTLRPMVKGKNTKVRIIGTPKGKNKFHELFAQYRGYHYPSSVSPFWDEEELEDIRTKVPQRVWEQEYLANFLDDEGSVFRGIRKCITNTETITSGDKGRTYVMGVDLAKHQDFTVIIIADSETKEVRYMDRFNKLDWPFQKRKIYEAWDRFGRPLVRLDSTGVGDAIYDDLQRAGMNIDPFKFTSGSKKELIENLIVAIENQEIFFPDIPELTSELELYEIEISRTGNVRYNAPDGFHDDIVIALALVNDLLRTQGTSYISFV